MLLLKFSHRVSTTPGNLWLSPEHTFQAQCSTTGARTVEMRHQDGHGIFSIDSFNGSADTGLYWERVTFFPKWGYIRWVPGSSTWTLAISLFSFCSPELGWFNFSFTQTKERRWVVQLSCWFMNSGRRHGLSILLPCFSSCFLSVLLEVCVADRRHETSGWRNGVRFGDGDRGRKQLLELVQHRNFVKENDISLITFKGMREHSKPWKTLPLRSYLMARKTK